MNKDYIYLLLNKEISLGKGFDDYERKLIETDKKRINQEIDIDLINKAIEAQKNDLKTLCLPLTNIPTLFFSRLERYTAKGLNNNIRMYKLYLKYINGAKTLRDVHINIAKDLKAKDLYNKIYHDQVKTLTVLQNVVKKIERKGVR